MFKQLLTLCALLFAACTWAGADANLATQAELDAIKGIGPTLAQRIIAQRQKAGFADWPDLIQRVHGIGNASAAKFSAQGLTVNGKAFPGITPEQARSTPSRALPAAAGKAPSPAMPRP